MSLGINSANNSGKLSVASDIDKVKTDDSGRFSEEVTAKTSEAQAKVPALTDNVKQKISENNELRLPAHHSSAGEGHSSTAVETVEIDSHAKLLVPSDTDVQVSPLEDMALFIDDLLLEDDSSGTDTGVSKATDTWTEGFGFAAEGVGYAFNGSFSRVPNVSSGAANSDVEQEVQEVSSLAAETGHEAKLSEDDESGKERNEGARTEPDPVSNLVGVFSAGNEDAIAEFLGIKGDSNSHTFRFAGFID